MRKSKTVYAKASNIYFDSNENTSAREPGIRVHLDFFTVKVAGGSCSKEKEGFFRFSACASYKVSSFNFISNHAQSKSF